MFKFVLFLVLFLGGIAMLGLAHELEPLFAGLVFAGGILAVSLAMAVVIHAPSNQTRRSEGLEG